MASSSSSSYSTNWTYDVFLSFRGEVRKNFVDHLYTALDNKGIYTFKDDQKLQRGKSISPELIKAIEESRFAIVVFSRNYASSSWCLDELVKIVECKNSTGQTVVPVFYDVDPSEVRKQKGSYAEAFAKHDENQIERETVERWRKALTETASISGWDVANIANGHESQCIKEIVENILTNLGRGTTSSTAEDLIGIKNRVKEVKAKLNEGSDAVRIIGIWGMGGMGKTTVSRAVFDEISSQFQGSSFVADVRKAFKSGGKLLLLESILSEILMDSGLRLRSVHEGITMMSSRLSRKRVLLVLDDVDHVNQLEALAGKRDWFGSGSRIIITTREKRPLVAHGVDEIHTVDLLNKDEALQLFSLHALKTSTPSEEYMSYSLHVVGVVGGLPLALKVLGSFLCGRDAIEWKSALDRLKDTPETEILDVLKISFDGLKDSEQQIFLDIACFFEGMEKEHVKPRLESFGFHPDIGISVLIDKSLLSNSDGRLRMHDSIKEMGWHIVRQMNPKEPGKHSRLWLHEDVVDVLTKNTGTEAIEGIQNRFQIDFGLRISSGAFTNMKKLRLLDVNEYDDPSSLGPEYLPNELRWLSWSVYPSKSLPASFHAEKLVSLEMKYSKIVELWKGKKVLNNLKFIDLSGSCSLTRTPDFSGAPNLEKLVLEYCSKLEEVHPSVGGLEKLVVLNLSGCKLESLPPIKTKSLETLILSECWNLKVFPEILVKIEKLTKLCLDNTDIKSLHPSIENLTNLETLDCSGCPNLEDLPENLGNMESLQNLYLNHTFSRQLSAFIVFFKNLKFLDLSYSNLLDIVVDFSYLSSLEILNLNGNGFACLPSSLCHHTRLQILYLIDCARLEALEDLPSCIRVLLADDCRSLKILADLSTKYKWLWMVSFTNCIKLLENQQRTSSNIADTLLQSLLQGHSVINHRFNILAPGTEIPDWFRKQGKRKFPVLRLPLNWHTKITGFAICVAFNNEFPIDGGTISIGTNREYGEPISIDFDFEVGTHRKFDFPHVFIGYISLDFFQQQCWAKYKHRKDGWSGNENYLSISFVPDHWTHPEKCGVRLVYREDNSTNFGSRTAISELPLVAQEYFFHIDMELLDYDYFERSDMVCQENEDEDDEGEDED